MRISKENEKILDPAGGSLTSAAEAGFSLIEVAVSMVVILIALLGVFATLTYAINFNAGNDSRAQALVILQQEIELMRSAKFTPYVTDSILRGGNRPTVVKTADNGHAFRVKIDVDNDPFSSGLQNESSRPNPTLKEITITVSLERPTPGWQTSVPATVILRRVRAN